MRLTEAAGRLSCIYKIQNRVKEKRSKATYWGLQEVEQQDTLLTILDAYKSALVEDLQVDYILNNVNWSALGLGDDFLNASPLFNSGGTSLGVSRH